MDFNTSSGLSDPVFGAKINGNDVLLQVRLGLILYYQLSNNLSTMNDFSLPSSADFKERRKSLRNPALWNNSKGISLIQVRKIYPTEELRVKKIIEYGSDLRSNEQYFGSSENKARKKREVFGSNPVQALIFHIFTIKEDYHHPH